MNKLYFITGASGAGKTTAVENLEKKNLPNIKTFYFDNAGVPSEEEMIEKYGSGENWQKETTKNWVKEIVVKHLDNFDVILDGQMRISFIEEACKEYRLQNYEIILIDCSNEERKKRLESRNQSWLYNEDMVNWSKYLRDETLKGKHKIIDNTNYIQDETLEKLILLIK
jgi:adenylate kinase family enzyme